MSFLKRRTTWTNGELWIFKWGVFTAGILAGYYLRQYLTYFIGWLWFMSAACCLISAWFWVFKVKK